MSLEQSPVTAMRPTRLVRANNFKHRLCQM